MDRTDRSMNAWFMHGQFKKTYLTLKKVWMSLVNNLSNYLFRAIICHLSEIEKSQVSKNDELAHSISFFKIRNFWIRNLKKSFNKGSVDRLVHAPFSPGFTITEGQTLGYVRLCPFVLVRGSFCPRPWNPTTGYCGWVWNGSLYFYSTQAVLWLDFGMNM